MRTNRTTKDFVVRYGTRLVRMRTGAIWTARLTHIRVWNVFRRRSDGRWVVRPWDLPIRSTEDLEGPSYRRLREAAAAAVLEFGGQP